MSFLKFKTNDDVEFKVEVKAAKFSVMIKTMLEALQDDENDVVIPLLKINSVTFKKVLEWIEHHKDEDPPLIEENKIERKRSDDISEWDSKFIDVDYSTLYDIVSAADYLHIIGLSDLILKQVLLTVRKNLQSLLIVEEITTLHQVPLILHQVPLILHQAPLILHQVRRTLQ
ncbi:hypothetical protein KQX54_008408 [Cotesia glomerata]|uniref:SKP1 component POZ domain-containing protein n=1 Tax=Cotesia glomerata TaxID=32391 RepID=A0AAV7IK37_COTGL|nr:hypothetical protein KQX54_008408 [Cotesia glomerata]